MTVDLNKIPSTYAEAVDLLAAWHSDDDVAIYYMPDPAEEAVQLVEVSPSFSDDDVLRPVAMGASRDFPFTSRILLLSQSDWERVKRAEKNLPAGWDLATLTSNKKV